jgi:orotate phosphoribosyltransferase
METVERRIAENLLQIGAVFLRPDDPFTWASGIKSPIYCDNRLTLSYPKVREEVERGLADLILNNYEDCQAVFGTSTAGIAHAALVADLLKLPMGYVRSGSKDHGRANQIEGKFQEGQKVVVVEDLISTAGSCVDVANVLKEAGCKVLGIVSIFTYNMEKGRQRLSDAGLRNISLSNLDSLVEVAAEKGYIKEADIKRILAFRANPQDSAWQSM